MADTPYEFIRTETRGHVFIVTMNRPEVMNAVHPPATFELAAAWDRFEADDDLWVGIITGAGDRAFSAGNDLKYQAAGGEFKTAPSGFAGLTHRLDCTKPILAAVNGLALGGGFEIALACDLIIAADTARFGLPEPKVGLAALAGGIHRLPRQIGLKNAMSMLLTGRHIDANEAFRLGIVQELTSAAELLPRTLAWAEQIVACAPLSVRATKEAALGGLGHPLKEALQLQFEGLRTMFHSEDFVEGPRAFAEKRPPKWKGH
jgi:enoyl-CoA hydratase/carnithine racemase